MHPPEVGAWQRAGISVGGGPLVEREHAVWLQVGDRYADSRGFAGTTCTEGRRIRWNHDVGVPGDDVGLLLPDGDGMVETGRTPDGTGYLEVWRPLPLQRTGPDGVAVGAWEVAGAQVVLVGDHLVHVDQGSGLHLRARDGVLLGRSGTRGLADPSAEFTVP